LSRFDVAIAGAGIVGCATAYELALRGVSVCLVDRGEVSSGTTGLGEGNVLCGDRLPGPELGLALAGLELYDELEGLLGDEAGIRRKGSLVIHGDAAGWAAEPARLEALRAAGVECELLDAERLAEVEPALAVAPRSGPSILGASFFPRDLQCAPRAIARALAREAAARGADVRTGMAVRGIAVAGGRVEGLDTDRGPIAADHVVLAAGAWSAPLARSAGLELPVEPRKGQLVLLECRPGFLHHKVIEAAYMSAVAAPDTGLQTATVMETTLDGHVLVGSSRERRGFDTTVDATVGDALLERAARFAPGLHELIRVDAWAGLRPWLPGGLPAIGPSRVADGLWIATGHEGAGVALGPITGRVVARGIRGESEPIDLRPFNPDRFAAE
jgi:glycine/D-amino acid oxidase-like deaminating enzyme